MKLMEVVRLIKEQDQSVTANKGILEFTNQNFTVTLFPEEKRMVFVPQFHSSFTAKMNEYVNRIREHFRVMQINNIEEQDDNLDEHSVKSAFEMVIDPREDWSAVESLVRTMAQEEMQ